MESDEPALIAALLDILRDGQVGFRSDGTLPDRTLVAAVSYGKVLRWSWVALGGDVFHSGVARKRWARFTTAVGY